jgi:RNA polymerase sigma factor (sigma-70 family)
LLGITKNVASDWLRHKGRLKRGGGATVESLEQGAGSPDATRWADLIAADERDEEFDREWAANLLRLAMDRLRQECEKESTPYFSVLLTYTNENLTYAQVGERLGLKESDVRNYLHKGRGKLRAHLEATIREYSSSEGEFQEDCAYLLQRLSLPNA